MKNQKKILFIIPPISERIWSNHNNEIYLGLGYIARQLVEKGHKVKLIDADSGFITLNSVIRKIKRINPDYIAMTSLFGSLKNAFRIARRARNVSNAQIVMGGLPATFIPEFVLVKCKQIDILVRGEGEATFLDIVNGLNLEKIDGISYRKENKILHNKDRKFISDLDSLGFPLRKIFPMRKYKKMYHLHNSTMLETSRGCPYGCDFCTQQPKEGSRLRLRSPEMVIKELEHIKEDYKYIKFIKVVDNDFLMKTNHAKKILKMIIQRKLNKRFHIMIASRVSSVLRGGEEIIYLLKKTNVNVIFLGIESACDKYLQKIGKINDRQKTIEVIKRLDKERIYPLASFIMGYPDETLEDINQTFNFAKKLNTSMFRFNIITAYPGTRFFEECRKKGLIADSYNIFKLDNSHQTLKHNLNIKKQYRRLYRNYLLRWKYISGSNSGIRFMFFVYYFFFTEILTILIPIKKNIKKLIFGNNCFDK